MTHTSVFLPSTSFEGVRLGIVVPLYNERDVLPLCLSRIEATLLPLNIPFEIILIDDGSHDGSGEWIRQARQTKPYLRLLQLSRNFGKEAALSAGLHHVRGDYVVVLDADLQDPPHLIPAMLATAAEGYDVVLMQRRHRQGDSWLKQMLALQFYQLLKWLSFIEIPMNTGDFRLMSRAVVNAINATPERNRFMKGLFAWVGFPSKTLLYDRPERAAGTTKWNFLQLAQLALEGLTSFSMAPLWLAMVGGGIVALLGLGFGCWIVLKSLVWGINVQGYPSLIAVTTFLGGTQLIATGILGIYMGKIFLETKQRPLYLIRHLDD